VIDRVKAAGFTPAHKLLPYVHVLDLAADGHIKPHIDSSRFCGDTVAVISLLSDSVARFVLDSDKTNVVDCLVRARSLYVMKNSARYDFTHEILIDKQSQFDGLRVPRKRRISVVCRCEP
jgi:alkylated DNA repair protein alkB family protein 7